MAWTPRPDERRALPLWFSWPGGMEMHRALRSRDLELGEVCDTAEMRAESAFGGGLRLWLNANWLKQVWVENYVLPDAQWNPKHWTKPRSHVFDGDILILPNFHELESVLELSDEALIALMLDAAPRLIDDAARRRGWGAVPWDGAVPEGGIKTSRQPMSAAKREKSLERLWAALEAAGADPKRPALDTIEALGDELHRRGKAACNEFHTGVHLALYELDREALFRQPVRDRGEDASQAPIPLSDDTFLYARAAVVLSGRQTFDQVLSDYPSFAAEPRDMDAEDLLTLAESVMDALDGELQPPPGLPSYETGSNAEHWSPQT
ncbi:MAG: DUF4240 domain-containing protein [Candidatus Nanopelagicales bacterium]